VNFNNVKNISILFIFLSIIFIPSVISQPVVQEVSCYPLGPMPLPYVTFTVGINNNNSSVDQVCLIVNECMKDLCSVNFQNLTMNFTYGCCMDFYETEFNFTREDATQLKYHLEILSNNTWYIFDTGLIN
jgi:hypothetical protein